MTAGLTEHVLRPRRERLAEALAVVTDFDLDHIARDLRAGDLEVIDDVLRHGGERTAWSITDPAEVWEVVALTSWVQAPERMFVHACGHCDGRGHVGAGPARRYGDDCERCAGTGVAALRAHPPTVAACVALAADVPGVLTAEQLAREVAARLGLSPARVVWRVEAREAIARRMKERDAAWTAMHWTNTGDVEDVLGLLAMLANLPAVAKGGGITHRNIRPATYRAQPALIALLATGYALDGLDADAVTLVCPALSDDAAIERGRQGVATP